MNLNVTGLLASLLALSLFIIPTWRIAQRAGFPGALSLLLLVPFLNLIVIWVFAFARWPGVTSKT
jgi:hypothetical protein